MNINGIEVVKSDRVDQIYAGQLDIKRRYIGYLAADGFYFMANDFRNMHLGKKWRENDPVLVASSYKHRPRYLWAVKPAA